MDRRARAFNSEFDLSEALYPVARSVAAVLLNSSFIQSPFSMVGRGARGDDICTKFLAGDRMEIVEQMRHITQCNLPFNRRQSVEVEGVDR